MDAKHKDALRELEIAALRGHPDGYATSDCTVTYKEAADALRAALARIDELETALASIADGGTMADYRKARALLQPAAPEAHDG